VNLGGQEHMGTWLITSQIASVAHAPIHGLLHLLFMQALSREQSEFSTHSGLHPKYGSPKYSGRHEQAPSWHIALAPHGDGKQGSIGATSEMNYLLSS
jgi:hypothetical protein